MIIQTVLCTGVFELSGVEAALKAALRSGSSILVNKNPEQNNASAPMCKTSRTNVDRRFGQALKVLISFIRHRCARRLTASQPATDGQVDAAKCAQPHAYAVPASYVRAVPVSIVSLSDMSKVRAVCNRFEMRAASCLTVTTAGVRTASMLSAVSLRLFDVLMF